MLQRFPSVPETRRSTLLSLAAILLWSTTIAFSRSLTEQLGTFTAAALIYTLAGLFGILIASLQPKGLQNLHQVSRAYLFGCGSLFVLYITALYLAVGMSVTREQVLVVGLINYLWSALSLLFSIPILGRRARPLLPVGILLALAGVWLATASNGGMSIQALAVDQKNVVPYSLALIAAVSWGLYSNLSRRWGGENGSGSVPLFLLASGILLGVLRLFNPETATWTAQAGLELGYMALFPGMLAYVLWDIAVRKGEIVLVASLSYLTPLLSTLTTSLVLAVLPGTGVWLGALLLISGAVICRVSVVEP